MDLIRRHQTDPSMVMILIIPIEEALMALIVAIGYRSGV
jgi:hypothetical protein